MSDPSALISEVTTNLEKRMRNLAKRKAKLESYKDILNQGGKITADQANAVNDYDSVCQSIETMKEIGELVSENQQKVSNAIKEKEVRMLAQREDYSINVFRKVAPILELLAKCQIPAVKEAIIKCSSFKDYKMLETSAKVLHVRIPSNFKLETLDSNNFFQSPAEFLFKLSTGSQEPLNGKNGKSKAPTYSDLLKYCYDVLTKDEVRSAMVSLYQLPRHVPEEPKQPQVVQPTKPLPVNTVETTNLNGCMSQPAAPSIPIQQADILLSQVINPLKSNFNFVQPALNDIAFMAPVAHPVQHQQQAKTVQSRVPVEKVTVPPQPLVEKKPQATQEVQKLPVTGNVESVKTHPVASHPAPQTEVPKPKPEPKAEKQPPPTAAAPSFQSLMESQAAEQKESVKEISNKPMTWADRVRGGKGAPAQSPGYSSKPQQQQPVLNPDANQTEENGGDQEHQQPRHKPGYREHRPTRGGFSNYNKDGGDGGERNNGNRQGPPRGGFRGNGRGRGSSFRGGPGNRGRGQFHPRGRFDGQHQQPRPEATQSTA